ncbi:GNAT family N-acetyltransferase [Nocardia sp. NPDC052566]|uniref:GNAT family N-acetyltransferase n=1 Tax=Nocardia sp. NPDC052566 TaxID=3364330 RepID=UPI0037C9F9A6
MPADLDALARDQLAKVLRDGPAPAALDPGRDLVETYGLTSLNKVMFLTSLCKAADVGLDRLTEDDLARMRTLGDVVEVLRSMVRGDAVSTGAWSEIASAVLANDHVSLHPVAETDREPLRKIAFDARIWTYFVARVDNDADFDAFFDTMLADQAASKRAVYVIVDKHTGRVAGSSSYGNLAEADRRLEIGWSWLGTDFQGRDVNRWAKYLLLEHAFETMHAMRVEFKTDVLNTQARAGLRKIGAGEEGVFRSYNYMPSGRRRDAVYYSILAGEWPSVKRQLRTRGRVVDPS